MSGFGVIKEGGISKIKVIFQGCIMVIVVAVCLSVWRGV